MKSKVIFFSEFFADPNDDLNRDTKSGIWSEPHILWPWLERTELKAWLKPVDNNIFEAYCFICKKDIDLEMLGVRVGFFML